MEPVDVADLRLREVAPVLGWTILQSVRHALGREAAGTVARSLGDGVTVEGLSDPGRWFSVEEVLTLSRAATGITGDRAIGRKVGEELFRSIQDAGYVEWFRATGSVEGATLQALDAGSKLSTGRLLSLGAATDDHLSFSAVFAEEMMPPGSGPDYRFFCDVMLGFYPLVPTVFGYRGTIVETSCQVDGAERCEFHLAWRADPGVPAASAGDVATSVARSEGLIGRFEQLQSMASDMVAVDDVDGVLERIIANVSQLVSAPQYLLAVDAGDGQLRVHHKGFRAGRAKTLTARVLADDTARMPGVMSVAIQSGDRRFGQLAAVFPRGTTATVIDERLLTAYATHAAAALNVIASLQAAHRDRDTAQALLALARSLADVASTKDIAARICDAVPHVVRCDGASVHLFDAEAGTLSLAATTSGGPKKRPSTHVLSARSLPEILLLADDPKPIMVHTSTAPDELARALTAFGVARVAVAPILASGVMLGAVTAGFAGEARPEDGSEAELFERLAGLADHAATALQNAKLLDRMRRDAMEDATTGLPNRVLIEDRGRQALGRPGATGRVGLLFVDLDRFKNVNDSLGHHAGDELIRAVADRFQSAMREGDTLARLGGDEFVVLLPDVDGSDDCVLVANRLIDVLARPFTISAQELYISCSIGIACSPQHGSTYDSLLQYADSAMYSAKSHGRGTFALDAASVATPRRRQLRLESQLHRALENGELRVHYQPQIDLASGRVVGAEALVRWQHPTDGLLFPTTFLTLAEETGLIIGIDAWVRQQAFQQARAWQDEGRRFRVAVNVGARTLANPELASIVRAELEAAGVVPELIELEINENVAMSDVDELPAALDPLRALGVRVAIDDFGTGSSVLRRLHHCEIDTLKIDRSFLSGVTDASTEAPLIKALLAMARSLELAVVAEGVETKAQAALLRRYGCELAQGYLFGRAVPATRFRRFLRSPASTLVGTP